MVLALPVVLGVLLGLAAGGHLRGIAGLRLKRVELFYVAIAIQVAAFPFSFLPWRTNDTVATSLWLASYAVLVAAAVVNRRITGVPLIAAGMGSNVIAVVANGGHMPALPSALRAAHKLYSHHFNSFASASPRVPWLVDRWAVPHFLLRIGNVYSVGDVVIAAGVLLVVVAAMEPRLPRLRRRGGGAEASAPPVVTGRPTRAASLGALSPELALVCPELAERARRELPARPWEMFVPGSTSPLPT